MSDEVPCKLCGNPTTGSIGAAGVEWPFICPTCKKAEDDAAMRSLSAVLSPSQPRRPAFENFREGQRVATRFIVEIIDVAEEDGTVKQHGQFIRDVLKSHMPTAGEIHAESVEIRFDGGDVLPDANDLWPERPH